MFARMRAHVAPDGRRLGDWPRAAIIEDVLERFIGSLKSTPAISTRNQYVQLLKASFRWAAKVGYVSRSQISGESTVSGGKVAQRRRRVSPTEEQALLTAASGLTRGAGMRLQLIIIAAVESGLRVGEMLAVRWRDVDLKKHILLVRAVEEEASKTGRSRRLPISSRLLATGEDGQHRSSGARVPVDVVRLRRVGRPTQEHQKGLGIVRAARARPPAHVDAQSAVDRVSRTAAHTRSTLSRPATRSRMSLAESRLADSSRAMAKTATIEQPLVGHGAAEGNEETLLH
jgi:integrase